MPDLEAIRCALAGHAPASLAGPGARRASVAVVLRAAGGTSEVLFIERARRAGDPWSGHMAFPGGRVESGDRDARSAAERETREEVGVDLLAAEPLGCLGDLAGRQAAGDARLVVSAFVYHIADPPPLVPNHEVREAFWFPLAELLDPARSVGHRVGGASGVEFPGILVGEPRRHVVWGLTYRFLEVFFGLVGRRLPAR